MPYESSEHHPIPQVVKEYFLRLGQTQWGKGYSSWLAFQAEYTAVRDHPQVDQNPVWLPSQQP